MLGIQVVEFYSREFDKQAVTIHLHRRVLEAGSQGGGQGPI